MTCKPSVGCSHFGSHSRHLAQRPERPCPPDLPGDLGDGICATEDLPVRQAEAHLVKQLLMRHAEQTACVRRLQGDELELVPAETPLQPACEIHACLTVRVVEDGGVHASSARKASGLQD